MKYLILFSFLMFNCESYGSPNLKVIKHPSQNLQYLVNLDLIVFVEFVPVKGIGPCTKITLKDDRVISVNAQTGDGVFFSEGGKLNLQFPVKEIILNIPHEEVIKQIMEK
jgi:hypothetical protein